MPKSLSVDVTIQSGCVMEHDLTLTPRTVMYSLVLVADVMLQSQTRGNACELFLLVAGIGCGF